MEYYYTNNENIKETNLAITDDEAKHLAKVLRKVSGEEIFVTDGKGNLYKCQINEIKKKEIRCSIIEKQSNVNEPAVKLRAYIALLKNPSRFEFAIEKLTELGAHEINPIITERVISKKKDKTERWQLIALSAMKQSQRCWLPKVNFPIDFRGAVKSCSSQLKLIAHEKIYHNRLTAPSGQTDKTSVSLFIGPEGGFSDEEVKLATENGFELFSLGNRKFRSETAAIAAAALILINIEN